MSTSLGDVLVRLRMDSSDLQTSATSANTALADLGAGGTNAGETIASGMGKAGDAHDQFAEKLVGGGGLLDEMSKKGEETGNALKGAFIGVAGAAGIGGLIDVAKNATTELQTLGVQFNSTFGGAGTADLKSAISDANQFGVSIGAAANAYQSFGLATKGTNENMKADMKDFSDIAAGTGESIDQVASSIGNYFQLVQRQGGAGGQSSRFATSLLTQHVIDPATYNQLRLQANQGANPQQLLNDILQNGESQYGGAGAAQSKTLGGEVQTFQNQFQEGTVGGLAPLMKTAQGGLADINKDMDSPQFKAMIKDFTDLTTALAKGVELLAPFAKALLEIAGGAASMADHFAPLRLMVEGLVAALVALKAINIASEMLGMSAATGADTASVIANTEALAANDIARVGGDASLLGPTSSMLAGGKMPIGDNAFYAGTNMGTSRLGQLGNYAAANAPMLGGLGLAIGGQIAGNAIGHGAVGSSVGDAISGAGIGTMIDPGVGTAVGAAAGLVVSAFTSSASAAAALSTSITNAANAFDKGHPIGTTASSIQTHYEDTSAEVAKLKSDAARSPEVHSFTGNQSIGQQTDIFGGQYWKNLGNDLIHSSSIAGSNVPSATANKDLGEAERLQKEAAGAEHNRNQNLQALHIADPDLSRKDLASMAATNNIDLSQPLSTTATAIEGLGSAATLTAEALSNKLANIGAQVGGTYGETNVNPETLLQKSGTSASDVIALAKKQGIDPGQFGITSASQLNQSMLTPQSAQQQNQTAGAANTLAQATEAVTAAEHSATEAGWSLTQAYFGASQAAFSLERAEVAANTANVTYASSVSALGTAITSGYLPANAQVAAQLAQASNLTSGQVMAINQEVASYNTLEATMYAANAAGQSLWSTYTELSNAVTNLQTQTQTYTDLLNTPLAGTKEYSAQQEQYKEQEAAVQQQISTLELARVPTQDPRIVSLQTELSLLQAQASLSTSINTQTVGAQQFQIAQAQIPSDTGTNSQASVQLAAAQSVGTLTGQLNQAKAALDAVAPSYTAVNGQLAIATQRNSAVTSSLSQLAGATQTQITADNGLLTASNGVVTAQQGVASAQWSVVSSGEAVANSQVAANAAMKTFASQGASNFQAFMNAIEASITNLGVTTGVQSQMITISEAMVKSQIAEITDKGSALATDKNAVTGDQALLNNLKSTGSVDGIPRFADGGVVHGPTLAVIGEAGTEYVIPESMLGGAQVGAGSVSSLNTGTTGAGSSGDATKALQTQTQAQALLTNIQQTGTQTLSTQTNITAANTSATSTNTQATNTQTAAQGTLHTALNTVSQVSTSTASQIINDQNNMANVTKAASSVFVYENALSMASLGSVAAAVAKNVTAMGQMEEIMGAISQAAGEFANSANQDAIVTFITQAEGLESSIAAAGGGIGQGAVTALLASLPKYEAGGVVQAGGGVPIMAHPGEIVLTSAQASAAAAGGIGGGTSVAVSGGGLTETQWTQDILKGLGAPDTPNSEQILISWANTEGGAGPQWHPGNDNDDNFNPLNTTLPWNGAPSTNSAGVKSYASWQDGINATLATFLNTAAFAPIVADFRANASHAQVSNDVARSGWGTGQFSNGGYVPGTGPVAATLHGGEFVLSNAMLSAMGNGDHGAANGQGGGGRTLVLEAGAIAVTIDASGAGSGPITETIKEEIVTVVSDALTQIIDSWD